MPLSPDLIGSGVGLGAELIMDEKARRALKEGKSAQDAAFREAAGYYRDLEVPDIEDLSYTPTEERYMGDLQAPDVYTPEAMESRFGQITTDPRFQEAQFQSLDALSDIVEGGGMTDMERLNAQRGLEAAQRAATTQGADIQQDMARRGMGGSGQEMLQKLAASQGAVNRAADVGQEQQAMAQQRALQAIMQKGGLSGEMQAQQFGQEAQKAKALDAARRFNIENTMGQRNKGTDLEMAVRGRNLGEKQRIAGGTAAGQTAADRYRAGATGQQYGFQQDKAAGMGGLAQARGAADAAHGQARAEGFSGQGKGISKAAGGIAKMFPFEDDENK